MPNNRTVFPLHQPQRWPPQDSHALQGAVYSVRYANARVEAKPHHPADRTAVPAFSVHPERPMLPQSAEQSAATAFELRHHQEQPQRQDRPDHSASSSAARFRRQVDR